MKKIKVCHLTSTHGNNDQRILIKECTSLARSGYDVYQVARGDSGEYSGVHLIGTGENKDGAFFRLLIRPRKVYKIARDIDADIYQIHDMELLPYAVKLKRKGKKVVFDYHEDFASRFADTDLLNLPQFIMKVLSRIYNFYEKRSIRKLDAMISVTPHICDRLRRINSNTVMVTNYPITEKLNPWATECEYDKKSDYICFAGQISCVQYALDTVVRAIQDVDQVSFKMYGKERRSGDIDYLKSLDRKEKVHYCGTAPFFDVPNIISGSRASVVTPAYTNDTNGREGTLGNNKLFEAMLRGVPVIFTDFDLWKEINDKYQFGISVSYGNQEDMKSAIEYIIKHPERAETMGKSGREAVLREYNWDGQKKKLLKLYDDLSQDIR